MSHGHLYYRGKRRSAVVPKLITAAVLAALGFGIRFAARYVQGFADLFAEYVNPVYVGTLGKVTGFVSFSVVEFLIYIILIDIAVKIVTLSGAAIRREGDAGIRWGRFLTNLCILVSLIFLLFECGEDVYFYRTPFSTANGIGRGDYSNEDLERVCSMLIDECNAYADQVERDQDGLMEVSGDAEARVAARMEELGESWPMLSGSYNLPKGVLFSYLMSKTDMAGIYSAYTSEANYNRDMMDYNKPFTMSHELSHTHGILQENEANFIAYLSCMGAEDADIHYAGAVSGWIYCGNELYKRDYDAWYDLASQLDARVNADLEANTAFWRRYKGDVSNAAQTFNDSYLKSHGQSEGTKSYDRVVDLIVSYETDKKTA